MARNKKANGGQVEAGSFPPLETAATDASPDAEPLSAAGADTEPVHTEREDSIFPIAGIGASAGGLTAFEAFFANMPADSETGLAFVVVQHLDPDHKSILTELIRRYTKMKVFEVRDGIAVEPNCIYIIPPNRDMALLKGRLHLMEPAAPRGLRLPIDFFFRSLAAERGEKSICIVLSGTGTDGTLGLRAVKEAGGMAMVQASESAAYDGMPRSALATGLADYILAPKDMPAQLVSYAQLAFGRKVRTVAAPLNEVSSWLPKVAVLLRSRTGHDFSGYKQTTIRRRIERRMVVHQIERADHYVQYLRQNPGEIDILFRELLIGVTAFFRDPEAFAVVEEQVIPRLFADRPGGSPVRVWVPGCSTGEEAYSLAILLQEFAAKQVKEFNIQVFATDIDHEAIETARAGVYPSSIAADVTAERLGHFFAPQGDNFFRIKKGIRDLVVFAEQDLIRDPPFSRVHLISCRNLLIYLEQDPQKKLIPLFHYALNPGGFLLLGGSETTGEFTDLFEAVSKKWKLYARKEGVAPLPATGAFRVRPKTAEPAGKADTGGGERGGRAGVRETTEKALLRDYAPACVTVNERGDILYVHGRTGKYLELAPGEISLNILRTAREGLKLQLATALRKAVKRRQTVCFEGLTVQVNGGTERVNLTVKPSDVSHADQPLFLVIFEDLTPAQAAETPAAIREPVGTDVKDQHIARLELDLRGKEEYLQTTIEELETANEELKSTNEELQSTNEELQSTNEELETSKEELQSVNEELVTVNTELQQKMEGLARASNDMNNLLSGTGIGTIFVDQQLRIQRFTPAATRIINLIQTDIGRPVGHIVSNLVNYPHMIRDVRSVLDSLVTVESEVESGDGQWYLMRILPYRTVENVIEGAVITFVEVTEQRRLRDSLRDSEERYRQFFECLNDAALIFAARGRILACNRVALQRYNYSREEFLRLDISDLVHPDFEPELNGLLGKLTAGGSFTAEMVHRSKDGKPLAVEVTASMTSFHGDPAFLLVARYIAERNRAVEVLRRDCVRACLSEIVRDSSDAVTVLDFDGRIQGWNPAAERLYGWSAEEALAMNVREIVPEKTIAEVDDLIRKLEEGVSLGPLETQRVAKDGRILEIRLTATALVDASGRPYAIATTERGVNKRRT